jgi:hypothetical protein
MLRPLERLVVALAELMVHPGRISVSSSMVPCVTRASAELLASFTSLFLQFGLCPWTKCPAPPPSVEQLV